MRPPATPLGHWPGRRAGSGAITRWLALAALLLLLAAPLPLCGETLLPPEAAGRQKAGAARLISNGGYLLAGPAGAYGYRQDELFVPASTIKILTSLAALEILGDNYRFHTEFFLDQQQNLYLRGNGDPLLTSAMVRQIAQRLHQGGLQQVRDLVLDDTAWTAVGSPPGAGTSSNPYDAPNGALAVNFNALPLVISATGDLSSGEAETPLLPMMATAATGLPPGRYRLNIAGVAGRRGLTPPLSYVGELFTAMLVEAGITVTGSCRPGQVPAGLPPLLHHLSPEPLSETVRACLEYSSNFIANQLFLSCGAEQFGPTADWQKGQRSLTAFATERLGLRGEDLQLVEGSGLARANRITATALIKVLEHFRPHAALLPRRQGLSLKSGTLSDVFSYAGYLADGSPFAILLNQPENRRDEVLAALLATHRGPVAP